MFLLSDEAKSIQSRSSLEAVMENGMLDSLMLSAAGVQSQTTQLKRSIWGLEERKTPFRLCVCVFVCVSGSDTFVEVGMPRSPSHSGNSNELKQMLASCKTSSGKRQALELLQGTKNSLLQYEHTSE